MESPSASFLAALSERGEGEGALLLASCSCGTVTPTALGARVSTRAAAGSARVGLGAAAPGTAGEAWAAGTRPPWGPSQGTRAAAAQALGCAGARDSPRGAAWRRGARYKEGGGGQREKGEWA